MGSSDSQNAPTVDMSTDTASASASASASLSAYIDLYNLTSDCVKLLTHDGTLLQMNAAGLCMIEADNFQQVENTCLSPLIIEEFRAPFDALSSTVFAGKADNLEFQIVGLKGTPRWLEIHATPLRDESGQVTALLGISRDITARKHAEQALHQSEQRFRCVIEAIPQQVWTTSPNGTLNYVNQRVLDYLGTTSEILLGSGWMEVVHPDDLPEALQRWSLASSTGSLYKVDYRIRRADGSYQWHVSMALPLHDDNGDILQWFGTNTDITAHKDIEIALVASEAHLATAQAHAHIGSWEINVVSGTSSASAQWFHITGFDAAQGMPTIREFLSLIHPDDLDQFKTNYTKALVEPYHSRMDFRLRGPDGSYRWFEARCKTICSQAGQLERMIGTTQDITDRKQSDAARQKSEALLAAAQARAKLGSWRHDLISGEAEWSAEMYRLFERNPALPPPGFSELTTLIHPDDQQEFMRHHERFIHEGRNYLLDLRLPQSKGYYLWIEARSETIRDAQGRVVLLAGTAQDITARKQAELALNTSESRFKAFMEKSPMLAFIKDEEGKFIYINPTFERVFQLTPQAIIGKTVFHIWPPDIADTLHQHDTAIFLSGHQTEALEDVPTPNGMRHWLSVKFIFSHADGQRFLGGTAIDMTERHQAEEALRTSTQLLEAANKELEHANTALAHIAHYDSLTHLPNRVLLADRMQQAMITTRRREKALAVAFLDLDGFKVINDRHGHGVGDELLITLASRMKNTLRDSDTLARIGGDEFVAVLTDLEQPSDCETLLSRLLQAAAEPVIVGENLLEVSASIGVTIYPQDGVNADQLLRHADQAMYLAKQAGKNCYHMFDVARDAATQTQREELRNIGAALGRNEFVLFYQPKVNMRTGVIIGVEALIRWQHPTQGLLPPAMFLPAIENHYISVTLGEWVIASALTQMTQWLGAGLEIPISVNIGALQLQQHDFPKRLEQLLAAYPEVNPTHLELEILETSTLVDIAQASTVIKACQALGVSFALDDFGTGYSSLAYLKRLPAEFLKIDQSFVRNMLDDPDDLAIIQGIIGLAAAFHRKVIAEGVETIAHGEMLLANGCELAQGFGIAHPMPAEDIPHWVTTWQPDAAWCLSSNRIFNH